MRKITIVYLAFFLLFQLSPIGGLEEAHAATGDSQADPIVIADAEQLSHMLLNKHYKLGRDIDLADYDFGDDGGWMPIGNQAAPFTGTLDGNGYAILNLTMNRPGLESVGLFGRIASSAQLLNIRLLDVNVTGKNTLDFGGTASTGGLVGVQAGTIRNAYVTGRVSASGADAAAGGLVGVNGSNGTIENSYAVVHVSGGSERHGGMAGTNAGTIRNCYAAGNVSGVAAVGGLVGYNYSSSGKIQNCYAAGYVSGNAEVGGLTGRQDSGATTANSYWNTETSGRPGSAGGAGATGVTTEDMKDPNTFIGWDPAVWGFRDGATYPYLRTFHMGIGVDPLAATTYTLAHGQDALSVTGQVYHETAGEQITVKYDIRNSSNVSVGSATYSVISDSVHGQSINRILPLDGMDDGDYTLTVTAVDAHLAAAGAELVFKVDRTATPPPAVSLGTDGSESWVQSASTTVTVSDSGGGVNPAPYTLQYAWSTIPNAAPDAGWTSFDSGDEITKSGAEGNWYLHIRAEDGNRNTANVVSNRFRLDNTVPTLSMTQAPGSGELTSGPVTVTAVSDGTGSGIAETRWADGVRSAVYFASGGISFTGGSFQVATSGTYTVYAKDQAGNSAVGTVHINNIIVELPQIVLTYNPTTVTSGSVVVTVAADVYGDANSLAKLAWMPGSRSAADFAGGANGMNMLGINTFEATSNGTYTVYAKDAVGNEAVEEIAIANIATIANVPDNVEGGSAPLPSSSPAPSSAPTIAEAPHGGITVAIDPSGIVKETLADGTVIEKVVLTDDLIEQVLELLGQAKYPLVTIKIDDTEQAVQVLFPAASLAKAREAFPDAVFEVKLNGSRFQLQINVLDLDGLAGQLGVDLQQLQVNVAIAQVTGQQKEQLNRIAGNQGLKLIGQAVEYTVTVSTGERTLEIRDFGGTYMVRAIVLDDNLAGNRLIAVLYDPADRTLSFVPAVLATSDEGRQEMAMKMPHNSIYAIMEAGNRSFADLNGHWAQQDVELMAAKLIVQGVSDTRFAPDDRITRAEFASLLVRALGFRTEGNIESYTFQDVSRDAWYAPSVEAAAKAGLVSGMSNDRFAPDSEITREQMAVMLANALTIVGKSEIASDPHALDKFSDVADISVWARSAIAQAVSAGIINGVTVDQVAPADHATRAQAAVMLKRFLQAVKFTD